MSFNVALLAPERIGGVICLSGAVFTHLQSVIDSDKDGRFADKKENLPIFIYHGKEDQVILHSYAAETYKKLVASGFQRVSEHAEEFLPHSVSPAEVKKISEFLQQHMI